MFVSSYNTYIATNTSDKIDKSRKDYLKEESNSFNLKTLNDSVFQSVLNKNLPIDYTSNYKLVHLLEEKPESPQESKFKKESSLRNAKNAYEDNSKMFSLIKKPILSLDLTPKIDNRLPQDIQEVKEKNLRNTMVSTYAANDRYYQIAFAA